MTRRDWSVDAAIAGAFVGLSVLLSLGLVDGTADRAIAVALGVVHGGALVARRRNPTGVLVVMAATALLCVALGLPVVVLGPAVIVAVYTLGARVAPPRSQVVLAAALLAMAVAVAASGMRIDTVLSNTAVLLVAWWLGERSRRSVVAAEAERAAAAETAHRAVIDERLRLARELHDVVAHAMSVIAVQAGTGRFVIGESPEVAAEALATIESTSREALQELRRLLTVLRDEEAGESARSPAPGVADIDELVEATTRAGIDVDLVVAGAPVPLPPGVDLCVYRVVQEALTNVRKHARAQRAVVTIGYDEAVVHVEVCDDGVGDVGAAPGGHGLLGMRERVELYGGSLQAGANGAGFRVAARIPVESAT